jgi:hypothetical protein
MIDLNVGTLTDLCRAAALHDPKSRVIINAASTAAFQPGLDGGLFRDQGVRPLADRLHEELKPHGSR